VAQPDPRRNVAKNAANPGFPGLAVRHLMQAKVTTASPSACGELPPQAQKGANADLAEVTLAASHPEAQAASSVARR
jgi:hypothetical protein